MAKNVTVNSGKTNCYELLAWLNETLQTGFTKLEQLWTGKSFVCFHVSSHVFINSAVMLCRSSEG